MSASILSCLGLSLTTTTYVGLILSILKIVGFLKFIELIYRVIWTVRRNLRSTEYLTERYGKGSWALITGGSDGIGLAMGKELARLNFNIIIVARTEAKMREAEKQIK